MNDEIKNVHDLTGAIEDLFPYRGSMDRAFMIDSHGHRIAPRTYALMARGNDADHRLLQEMRRVFVDAKHTLGNRDDVGVIWRRTPHLFTEDDGKVLLRMRLALVDSDGQIDVAGLPQKVEGMPSRSID